MQLVRSLGDLDGHLVRSWIVSREARARMMMCSVWTYYCRTAEEYSFTVERGGSVGGGAYIRIA